MVTEKDLYKRTVYLKVVHYKHVLVTIYNSSSYGKEAELIEESIYELW